MAGLSVSLVTQSPQGAGQGWVHGLGVGVRIRRIGEGGLVQRRGFPLQRVADVALVLNRVEVSLQDLHLLSPRSSGAGKVLVERVDAALVLFLPLLRLLQGSVVVLLQQLVSLRSNLHTKHQFHFSILSLFDSAYISLPTLIA